MTHKMFKIEVLGNEISGILRPSQCCITMMSHFRNLGDSSELPNPPSPAPRSAPKDLSLTDCLKFL